MALRPVCASNGNGYCVGNHPALRGQGPTVFPPGLKAKRRWAYRRRRRGALRPGPLKEIDGPTVWSGWGACFGKRFPNQWGNVVGDLGGATDQKASPLQARRENIA